MSRPYGRLRRRRAALMGWSRRRLRESRKRQREALRRPVKVREGLTFGSLDELLRYMNGPGEGLRTRPRDARMAVLTYTFDYFDDVDHRGGYQGA